MFKEEGGVVVLLLLPWRDEEGGSSIGILAEEDDGDIVLLGEEEGTTPTLRGSVAMAVPEEERATITRVEAVEHSSLVSSLEGHGAGGRA